MPNRTAAQSPLARHLKQHGLRLTRPREMVFAALQDSEPQTMQQLVLACPDIDRASVYRTITLFEQLGITQRLQIGWKYKLELTDTFSHHHHHLTCLRCGTVIEFDENPQLARDLKTIADTKGFLIQTHQLEVQGLCEICKLETTVS